MDPENTTIMNVTNTCTVSQLAPSTSLIATTTLTTTIASRTSPDNTSLIPTTTLETSAFPSKINAFTSTVLTSSPPPVPQSSYSFVSTGPTMGPLLAGVLSVVGILSIAAVITVVVLIVVIRGRKKAAITVKNERYATLCSYTVSCKVW